MESKSDLGVSMVGIWVEKNLPRVGHGPQRLTTLLKDSVEESGVRGF